MTFYNSLNSQLGVRVGRVGSPRSEFDAPATLLTGSEIGHLENLSAPITDMPIPDAPAVIKRQEWDEDKLEEYRENPEYRRYYVREHMGNYSYRGRIWYFRPKVKAFLDDGGLTEQQGRDLVRYGVQAGFDWISAHDPAINSSPREFDNHLESLEDEFQDHGQPGMELMPTFHLKSDPGDLVEKIEKAHERGYNKAAVNVRALSHEDSLKAIRRFSDSDRGQDMLLVALNCERMRPKQKDIPVLNGRFRGKISARHLLPFFGFDLVGYNIPPNIPGDTEVKDKWLVRNTGVYLNVQDIIEAEEFPACQRQCCDGVPVSKIISDWRPHGKATDKTWLHDITTIEHDFKQMREAAKNGRLDAYLEMRSDLKDYLTGEMRLEIQR